MRIFSVNSKMTANGYAVNNVNANLDVNDLQVIVKCLTEHSKIDNDVMESHRISIVESIKSCYHE